MLKPGNVSALFKKTHSFVFLLKLKDLKRILFILTFIYHFNPGVKAQTDVAADFSWGNSFYFNLNVGQSIHFKNTEVKLLGIKNHYNHLKIGEDTLWLKVARRSLPEEISGLRIFVADNKKVKSLTSDNLIHGLLTGDALVCLSESSLPLLDPVHFVFPVSFNDGFSWTAEEDTYPYSLYKQDGQTGNTGFKSYHGVGFDLNDARGKQKHWLVSVENARVAWVQTKGNETSVMLGSESQPDIYYLYSSLYSKSVTLKKGQKLSRGDVIGTAWGNRNWGHAVFSVIKSEAEPNPDSGFHNIINCFPQLFDLYFRQEKNITKFFTRGRIMFGKPEWINGNKKNTQAYEKYSGKGWITDNWNPADKVDWVNKGNDGNVRLNKILFEGTLAQSQNPHGYFEYRINVRNGTYRIRAKVGDLYLPSWQKIEFEGVLAAVKSLDAGNFDWTPERVVKVEDGSLNIRIYIDPENEKVAGLNEIVFQRAF
jgi:hypothetical protein